MKLLKTVPIRGSEDGIFTCWPLTAVYLSPRGVNKERLLVSVLKGLHVSLSLRLYSQPPAPCLKLENWVLAWQETTADGLL